MQRIICRERADWREKAAAAGFLFHTIDGLPYWDESAYYAFTLKEIEDDLEAPTAELERMCRELVARAVEDAQERLLADVLRLVVPAEKADHESEERLLPPGDEDAERAEVAGANRQDEILVGS